MMRMCALMEPSCRQRETELRALPLLGLGPDRAAMSLDQAPGHGQPHAQSLEFILGVHTLKHSKQATRVLRIETDAVVLDGVDDVTALSLAAHGDAWLRDRTREFKCIGQQVVPHQT